MTAWGSVLRGVVAIGLMSVAGCGVFGSQPWAAEAEAWLAGMDEASDREQFEQGLYMAVDAVGDSGVLSRNYYAEGRWQIVQLSSKVYGWDFRHGPVYLGQHDAVRTDIWLDDNVGVLLLLAHMRIGDDGIEQYTHLAPTWMHWTFSIFQSEAIAAVERIAADYLAAWSSRDSGLIEQLYTADATLTDDLLGQSAEGPAAIAATAAASAPIVAATNAEVLPPQILNSEPYPDPSAPAVFLHFSHEEPRTPTQVWVMVHSEGPCPGSAAVALRLDDQQQISAEQRFRAVESMRGCLDPERAPVGWWTDRDLPLPFAERITGSIDTRAGSVEIRNGSNGVDAVVRWGFDRFRIAGLPAPTVSSITFDPFDDRCASFRGYADWDDGSTDILVCYDASGIGPPPTGDDEEAPPDSGVTLPQQGHLLLHELGHAWLANHTDSDTREAFLDFAGLDSWSDKDDQWNQRGVEWAAETLAWGLQGAGHTSLALGGPDCDRLAEGFRILTGIQPLTSCDDPAEPAPVTPTG